jgi:Tetracyclin repressor-like, C-terminal domain
VLDVLAAARRFAIARPMLFEVMTSRLFVEFSPDEHDSEAAAAIYRLIVGAVRRWLSQAGSTYDAREAAHIIVAAHRGIIAAELAGIASSSPRTVESRGVDAVLAGIESLGGSERRGGRPFAGSGRRAR